MTYDVQSADALLEWKESLETGMALIDEQHRTLVEQIKVLADHSRPDRVLETIVFLQNYVVEHFGTEERMHRETDYPRAEEHRDVHKAFIQAFLKFKKEYDANGGGERPFMLLELTKLLSVWLEEHITGMDRWFADYYHASFPASLE